MFILHHQDIRLSMSKHQGRDVREEKESPMKECGGHTCSQSGRSTVGQREGKRGPCDQKGGGWCWFGHAASHGHLRTDPGLPDLGSRGACYYSRVSREERERARHCPVFGEGLLQGESEPGISKAGSYQAWPGPSCL